MIPQIINGGLAPGTNLPKSLLAVLHRRGIKSPKELNEFLNPSSLPNPHDHFEELNSALERLMQSCAKNEKIAICGDYDADGTTGAAI